MCLNPIKIRNPKIGLNVLYDAPMLTVPCNNCYQCKSAKQYDLEIRSVAEFQHCQQLGGAVYNYTLTYNDEHLPLYFGVPVLKRRDMQLFKKRLLKRCKGVNIDVQYCGEYGRKKDRPHWHILIYSEKFYSADDMALNVKMAWSISHFKYVNKKRVYYYDSIGFVGYPCKYVDGRLFITPQNAIIDSVHAIRYTVKYISKSYNFYQSLLSAFRSALNALEVPPSQHFDFVFPPAPEYGLNNDADLRHVARHFSSCYRNPIGFGLHEYDYLNDDYEYISTLKNDNGENLKYPISKYLKDKLFHISCIYSKDSKETRLSKKWLDYMSKNFNKLCQDEENYYICNQNISICTEIKQSSNILNQFNYVKDVINYICAFADCTFSAYIRYVRLRGSLPFLAQYSDKTLLAYKQCRDGVGVHDDINSFLLSDCCLNECAPLLLACKQSIAYASYLASVERYNERQNVIALEFSKYYHKTYEPHHIDSLPFSKFINFSNLTKEDVKAYY